MLVLTPLVLASCALCFDGSWYFFTLGELLIGIGLLALCFFLLFLYVFWLALSIRYHVTQWRKWRQENQVVEVVVSKEALKHQWKQQKTQSEQQETVV